MPADSQPTEVASWDAESGRWLEPCGMSDVLFGPSEPFSGTWPTSGMTVGGTAYELPTSGRPTAGPESSSSPTLLATPQSRDYKGRPADGFNTANLVRDIENLMAVPTSEQP